MLAGGGGCEAALPKVNVPEEEEELGAAAGAELPKEKEGLARVPKEGTVVGAGATV